MNKSTGISEIKAKDDVQVRRTRSTHCEDMPSTQVKSVEISDITLMVKREFVTEILSM